MRHPDAAQSNGVVGGVTVGQHLKPMGLDARQQAAHTGADAELGGYAGSKAGCVQIRGSTSRAVLPQNSSCVLPGLKGILSDVYIPYDLYVFKCISSFGSPQQCHLTSDL